VPGWLQIAVALAVVVGTGFTLGKSVANHLRGGDVARLELGQTVVSNRTAGYGSAAGALEQSRDTTPRVDLTLRNSGSAPTWIAQARITIVDSALLRSCIYGPSAGGQLPQSKPYRISLPDLPLAGERVIHWPLHEEVPAGAAYRVLLAFQPREWSEADRLYALRVELIAEHPSRVLEVGRFVLGVPGPVSRAGGILPEDAGTLRDSTSKRLASTWCFRRNLTAVRRVLSHRGDRTAQIAALSHAQLAGNWPDYADGRPPRQAVEPLLRSGVDEAPAIAAFAAAAAGDQALETSVRRRGVAMLLEEAREVLGERWGYAPTAIAEIHQALDLTPGSASAKRLLRRAEASQQAEEEEGEEDAASPRP
jgi:hypothetical protein